MRKKIKSVKTPEQREDIMKDNNTKKMPVSIYVLMWVFTPLIIGVAAYLTHTSRNDLISHGIMGICMGSIMVFVLIQANIEGSFSYDNESYQKRFFFVYLISLIVACIFCFIPTSGWIFPVMAVALALFSSSFIGLITVGLLIIVSVVLSGASVLVFAVYFISCVIAIICFRNIDEALKVGFPFIITLSMEAILIFAGISMYSETIYSIELLLIPCINLFVTGILLLLVLKMFSVGVIHKYTLKYMEINDQEYYLLKKLKEFSKPAYYQAIHTAYFCERIANRLQLDVRTAKAGGYYYHIGALEDEVEDKKGTQLIAQQNQFPPAVNHVFSELLDKKVGLVSKEAVVVYFADAVITSILFLFQKNPEAKVNYEEVIKTIFSNKINSTKLNKSQITMGELRSMEQIFKEENLYYDFLR